MPLQRVSAEEAATSALRHVLATSVSLAVLKPRLANLNAQIIRECPPDRTIELERLTYQRNHSTALWPGRRPGEELRRG